MSVIHLFYYLLCLIYIYEVDYFYFTTFPEDKEFMPNAIYEDLQLLYVLLLHELFILRKLPYVSLLIIFYFKFYLSDIYIATILFNAYWHKFFHNFTFGLSLSSYIYGKDNCILFLFTSLF